MSVKIYSPTGVNAIVYLTGLLGMVCLCKFLSIRVHSSSLYVVGFCFRRCCVDLDIEYLITSVRSSITCGNS